MLEIANVIVVDLEVALVHGRHERQRIHVFQDRSCLVVHDAARGVAVRQARDSLPIAPLGDFLDREIELVAGDEVDHLRRGKAPRRVDRDFRPDQPRFKVGVDRFHRLDRLDVGCKRWRRRVQNGKIEVARRGRDIGELQALRWRIDEFAALDQRCGLGKPRRIPERTDLPPRLVTRPRAAVESVERRGLQKKRTHHVFGSTTGTRVPSARTL